MIRAEVLSRPCVGIDEAPVRILSTDQSGYIWVIANNYGAYYRYEMTGSGKVGCEILKGFKERSFVTVTLDTNISRTTPMSSMLSAGRTVDVDFSKQ